MLPPPPRIARATEVAPNSSHSVQSGSSVFTRRRLATCQRPGRKSKSVTGMRRQGTSQTGQNLPSMGKTERVLRLLEALQDRPFATGPELGARLGVDVRTVRRDVVSLQDLGIPVEAERGPAGGYRLRPGYRMPPLMLTPAEATAVALGLLPARRDGLDADGALAKIRRVLPEQVRPRVEALEQTLSFTAAAHEATPPKGENLLLLADAALRGRRVLAVYETSDGVQSERELSPYGVVSHRGRWYVPAYDHGRDALRALRADRFCTVQMRRAGRPAPPGFEAVAFVTRTLARVPWTHE